MNDPTEARASAHPCFAVIARLAPLSTILISPPACEPDPEPPPLTDHVVALIDCVQR